MKKNSLLEEELTKYWENPKKEITCEIKKQLNELRNQNQKEIK